MRKISSRSSLLMGFLPRRTRCCEIHFQYNLNPERCLWTTVSGCTMKSACFHPDQNRRKITQNSLSAGAMRGEAALPRENGKLLTKSKIFKQEIVAGLVYLRQHCEEKPQRTKHSSVVAEIPEASKCLAVGFPAVSHADDFNRVLASVFKEQSIVATA